MTDREQIRRDIVALDGAWKGVGERLAALLAELEQAERERDEAREQLEVAYADTDEDIVARLAKVPALLEALREVKAALDRERGGGSPLTRQAYLDLHVRVRDALNAWERE